MSRFTLYWEVAIVAFRELSNLFDEREYANGSGLGSGVDGPDNAVNMSKI